MSKAIKFIPYTIVINYSDGSTGEVTAENEVEIGRHIKGIYKMHGHDEIKNIDIKHNRMVLGQPYIVEVKH